MKCVKLIVVTLFLAALGSQSYSQVLERKDVPEKYKWNLKDLYASTRDWTNAKDNITKMLGEVESYKGRLGTNADTLYSGLKLYFNMLKELYRLSDYASRLKDENLTNSANQALYQQASNLGIEVNEKTAFMSPEILHKNPETMDKFYKENNKLDGYQMFIENIQRLRSHTLSAEGEKILASFGMTVSDPSDVYNIFNDAEMPNPDIVLSSGDTVKLTNPSYVKYRVSKNREDRKEIFSAFFDNYENFQNTIGANLASKVKADVAFAKDRNYKTALQYSLDQNNIPVSVYKNLITQIHNSLPTLQRYLDLKKKMLGVDTLHYYDLYTSVVKKVDMNFTIPDGEDIILKALKPLGEKYLDVVKKAFDSRWIDFMPTKGKQSGGYESGASYDVHPYILVNWTGDYNSLTTLAHELGHMMHSYLSNKNQPFQNSQYPIFVAEIASTTNESLLNYYMVKNAQSNDAKLYLLGNYLELLRVTIFRQALFAEFELKIHQMVEDGQALTGEDMSKLYLKLVEEYYGDSTGHCVVDPSIAYEWEYIPHFVNYTYYVYQYSTSLIYATAFAQKIINEGQPAVDKYKELLKGGYSEYPIDLIKNAGIDPLSAEPFKLTMQRMNQVMDQMEEILNSK
jgi:oligoendopeptidase F